MVLVDQGNTVSTPSPAASGVNISFIKIYRHIRRAYPECDLDLVDAINKSARPSLRHARESGHSRAFPWHE
jgi:hypothetical protein